MTDEVFKEIGAQAVPRIRVFNKIDCVGDPQAQAASTAALLAQYPDCMVMSARREEDTTRLHAAIRAFFQKDLIEAELFLPWSAQQLRGEVFALFEVLEERADGEGTFFRIRGEPDALSGLRARVGQTQ